MLLTLRLFAWTSLFAATACFARDPTQLDLLKDRYPRAFFFRASERAQSEARYPTFESWESEFDRLWGIMGKCLEEECLGREKRNPAFFGQFKEQHPNQAVLLHFNGNSRNPLYRAEDYFPGHWIYRRATEIVQDVPAETGESVIKVADAGDFRVNSGRYRTSNDDVALFGLTADGKHDWSHCEQVQLLEVDRQANMIKVKRGCYGTQPLAFRANQARTAAHATEGPWGKTNHLLWYYNYATHCPKDRAGKTCADRLVDELAAWFGPGGTLEAFDGLEFDVMFNETHGDTEGDGMVDDGVKGGVNQYGIGMVEFARHRLSLAACQFFDAMVCYSFAPKNDADGRFGIWDELRKGAENQLGWLGRPEALPVRLAASTPDLLQGQGIGAALAERISGPVKATISAKGVRLESTAPGAPKLRFALKDLPANGADLSVFLELKGDPLPAYPHELARFAQVGVSGGMVDLLAGAPLETGMRLRGAAEDAPLNRATGATVQRTSRAIGDHKLPVVFVHPPYRGPKGCVFWAKEADVPENAELQFSLGMAELAPERSDGIWFRVLVAEVINDNLGEYTKVFETSTNKHQWLPQTVSLKDYAGKRLRFRFVADCGPNNNATTDQGSWGGVKIVAGGMTEAQMTEAKQYMTWVNDRFFAASFYYRHVKSPNVDLTVTVEGTAPVTLWSVTAHAHPDAVARVFEGGLVLANPSLQPYTFDLAALAPGRSYRRLQATANQDTETNNGQPVGATVTLGERDALFLIRRRPGDT